VELIDAITAERGQARAVDLAKKLGVSHVTVAKTIQRLIREGLVTAEPYRAIFLTDKGRKMAKESHARHELVRAFLIALGVSPDQAETDTEGIEHHVSKETLAAMRSYLEAKRRVGA
jgi:DtxR family transcriptional regulator, manganese transport regulator